jgi:hypothetical protein
MFYVMPEECIDSFHKSKPTLEEQQYKARLPEGFKLQLVRPHMNEGFTISNLPRNLKIMIMKLCKIEHSPSKEISAGVKRRCSYWPGGGVKLDPGTSVGNAVL